MPENYFVGRYDLSLITDDHIDKVLAVNKYRLQVDNIDAFIKNMTLQNEPQVFGQLLKELSLHKFWEKLISSDNYFTFEFLAKDRVLNFYEAATSAGMNIHDLHSGIIISILSATTRLDVSNRVRESHSGPRPVFLNYNQINLEEFELQSIDGRCFPVISEVLTNLAKSASGIKRMNSNNRLEIYLIDAFKMWVISNDPDVIRFMVGYNDRIKFITKPMKKIDGFYIQLGTGRIHNYKALTELTCFNTVWARAKSFKYNTPAKVKYFLTNT